MGTCCSSCRDTSERYDLIIIGGGSAGFSAAIRANEKGLKTLIINGGLPIGGTCVNVGCVPSKFLVHTARKIYIARQLAQSVNISLQDIVTRMNELVSDLRKRKYIDVLETLENVDYHEGKVQFVDSHTVECECGQRWEAEHFIIATGSRLSVPHIEGLDRVPFDTSQTIMQKTEIPIHLIIIGAGYIGLELGQAYKRLGANVSILEQRNRLGVPEKSGSVLRQKLESEGIKFYLSARIRKVQYDKGIFDVEYEQNGKVKRLEGTTLLVATGRKPNTDNLSLDRAGVETIPSGHIKVNEYLQTTQHHIYAVGDCINTPALVYTAAYEGKVAVDNIAKYGSIKADYTGLPFVVFTEPQVAYCGRLEENENVEEVQLSMEEVPACLVSEETNGFIRLLRDKNTDLLVGAEVVSSMAGEVIIPISLAIKYKITVKQITDTMFPYLTYGESFKLGALSFEKDIKQLSCCAG